jgi:cytosine deaminase
MFRSGSIDALCMVGSELLFGEFVMNHAEFRRLLREGTTSSYAVSGLCAPAALINAEDRDLPLDSHDIVSFDLRISGGRVSEISPPGTLSNAIPGGNRIVFPCFADIHTHLDLGHVVDVAPNYEGTHFGAVKARNAYRMAAIARGEQWLEADLERRMEFALRSAYAHGTMAMRTHLDSLPEQVDYSWKTFARLRERWRGKMELQGVPLLPIDNYLGDYGRELANRVAAAGGILGGVTRFTGQGHGDQGNQDDERMRAALDVFFRLAAERDLDVDLHVDETGDPKARNLDFVARAALACSFTRQIVCGHCCSLAVRPQQEAQAALNLCHEAGLAIVSMPHVNLYLLGRVPGCTPRWRGISLLRELHEKGVPVALATDDVRDHFYPYGDHDLMAVLAIAILVGHLDQPWTDWPSAITKTPADLMRLPDIGRLRVGSSADLVIFPARRYSELLAHPDNERVLIRAGIYVEPIQADYSELDESRQLTVGESLSVQ